VRAVRPGKYGPAGAILVEGPGDKSQPYFWRYPWRSGEVLWCAFDHGSIAGDEGKTGIIDYFRLPKRAMVLVSQ
jgi:beta-galactosidase